RGGERIPLQCAEPRGLGISRSGSPGRDPLRLLPVESGKGPVVPPSNLISDEFPVSKDVLEVRVADLIELVPDVDHGLFGLEDSAQIDGRAAQDDIDRGRIDRLLEFLDLLRSVAHRREDLPGVRIFLVRLLDRADGVYHRADNLGRSEPLCYDVGRAIL